VTCRIQEFREHDCRSAIAASASFTTPIDTTHPKSCVITEASLGRRGARQLRQKASLWVALPTTLRVDPGRIASWLLPLSGMLLAAMLVWLRRPDVLTNPQFYGEDGVYFANVYNHGLLATAITPQSGYLQTFPALTAGLARLVPLHHAPLVMNAAGILPMVLPLGLLLTRRAEALGPSLATRTLLGLLIVALPGVSEVHATSINSQWYLSISAVIVLLLPASERTAGRIFDRAVLLICGLTGVYVLVLLPVALLVGRWRGRPVPRATIRLLSACVALQIIAMVYLSANPLGPVTTAGRSSGGLDASVPLLWEIVGGRVILGTLVGDQAGLALGSTPFGLVAVLGVLVVAVAVPKQASVELRAAVLFAAGLLALALVRPLNPWPILAAEPAITRYWLLPKVAFVASMLWCVGRGHPLLVRAVASAALACTMLVGIPRDWSETAPPDSGWAVASRAFEHAAPGTRRQLPQLPLVPPGAWSVDLVHH